MHRMRRLLRYLARYPYLPDIPESKHYDLQTNGVYVSELRDYIVNRTSFLNGRSLLPWVNKETEKRRRLDLIDELMNGSKNRGYIEAGRYDHQYLVISTDGRSFINWKGLFYASEVLGRYGGLAKSLSLIPFGAGLLFMYQEFKGYIDSALLKLFS